MKSIRLIDSLNVGVEEGKRECLIWTTRMSLSNLGNRGGRVGLRWGKKAITLGHAKFAKSVGWVGRGSSRLLKTGA